MKIKEITQAIESFAPLAFQEDYDNAGLLLGNYDSEARAALLCIDVTETVIDEAIAKNCNLIIAHHPLIFKGLKSIIGKNEVERCVLKALKNDIAVYAAHTNLDNVEKGVSFKMAEKIGLHNLRILQPQQVDFYASDFPKAGAGVVGELETEIDELAFLQQLKIVFGTPCIKHSPLLGRKIKRVALCGGAGSFLIGEAKKANADVFVTGDVKYHDFFLAENHLFIADIGHFESEQYTKEIFFEIIRKKIPTFAVHFSETENRVHYF
ncbi:MAG: Nif3-like dinuclear metal center hexameric protein [Prevotellaceae bacterium]|jgi:dinuclear metal center YbgI/SA1388 family protein|nr:Nif3-like dinuclear metal center hexameric protein [Prevotellaceae bacterium]